VDNVNITTIEDNFLNMLVNSAGVGGSLFTSWEPGRKGKFYFMTTKNMANSAEEWLDSTMTHLLNLYGIYKCVRVFGSKSEQMPRGNTKVRPDSFILDYIHTLQIGKNLDRERGGKERVPPDNRPAKKRALVVYGDSGSNAWNIPLMDNNSDSSQIIPPKESIDLMKGDNDTTASNYTISQLTQDLAFLRKDFNESIHITNKKSDEESASFLDKISTLQKSADTSIGTLSTFIKGTLIA